MQDSLIARIWKVENPVWVGVSSESSLTAKRWMLRRLSDATANSAYTFPCGVSVSGEGAGAGARDVPTKPLKHSICAWKGTWRHTHSHTHTHMWVLTDRIGPTAAPSHHHRPRHMSALCCDFRFRCRYILLVATALQCPSSVYPFWWEWVCVRVCQCVWASVCLLILLSSRQSRLTAVSIRFSYSQAGKGSKG